MPSKKKKKTRTPNKEKPSDPVQGCPLQKKADPKYCYLTALEITKGDHPKRTRWGKDATKFVVFPGTVREKEESNTSAGFPVFDPVSVNDSSAPQIYIVAVRPNLVDKDNKAMTILAQLRDPTKSDKPDDEHAADAHHLLKIDRTDDSALRTTVQGAIDALVEAFDAEKKIKETWKDLEERREKLEDGISKLDSDPKGAQQSIEEALTFDDDDAEEDDDDEGDDYEGEEDDDEEDGDDDGEGDQDDDNDAEDQEDAPHKLKAEIYPQDPTISKLFEKAPVALAKWCPEKYDWAAKVPKITDVLRALWLKDFDPRVYNITATSCGDAPPDKATEATQSLRAQILVYPADQFKFILRVPKLAKGSVGYEGRYISKTGEFKSVKTSAVEIKGVTKKDDDDGEEEPGTEDEDENQDDKPKEGDGAEGDGGDEGFGDGPDLYDPDSYEDDDDDDEEEDDDDEEDDDEEEDGAPLLQISEDKWILPWDEEDDDEEEDGDKEPKSKSKDKGGDDDEIKELALKLIREPQPPAKEEDDDKEAKADKDDEDLELDYTESLNAVFNVIQSIREVWDKTKGLSFTLGFSIEATIGFLEGKADWEWGWRESTRLTEAPTAYANGVAVSDADRQMPLVVYSQKYSAKLTILSIELALKLGIDLTYAGIGFRAALVGTVSGKLDYESDSIQEYCPQMEEYFKSDPEKWVVSTIEGTLEAKAILLSADTFRATSKIKTGYWIRAKRGDDESPQIAYEWRFLGLKMTSEFKIKGYKNVATEEVILLKDTPESHPHKGTFPTYASKTPYSFRQTLMEYKNECWDIQEDMQSKMTELRVLYFSKFFPKLWPKIQAAANVKNKPLIWGVYDDYRMDNWIAQVRRIAKTAPDGQIALGIQHKVRRGFAARTGYSSWATRSGIWDAELEGMLVPDNTDLDVMGKDMGEFLWNLRMLGAFYKRFVVFCEILLDYSDKAITASRTEERKHATAEPSEDFKKQFLGVGRAFRDIMYGPEKDGKKEKDKSGWKDGKFQACYQRIKTQLNGFNMSSIASDQLVTKFDNAKLRNGSIKFNYPLSTAHSGYWTNDELSNSKIKWQKKN